MKIKQAGYDYNIIVIGAGSGGLVAALIAAATGARVALIEADKMGGDCLNTGCVPSKALIAAAKQAYQRRNAERMGVTAGAVTIDFEQVMHHVHRAIATIAPHDSVERFSSLGVDCITAKAVIEDAHHVRADQKRLSCRSIIVATGARPYIPDIPGLRDSNYLCSDNLWKMTELPKKLLVLGAGPMGVEMAQAYARLGSNVTLADKHSRLLHGEDEEIAVVLQQQFEQEGIALKFHHQLIAIEDKQAVFSNHGDTQRIDFDAILVALGRQANIHGFGLEDLGVTINTQQRIDSNAFMQTNIDNIYVCGDVCGPYQFTHAASQQAWYACINALFSPLKRFKIDYENMAWCTYSDPPIARLGLNKQQAQAKNIPYEATRYELEESDRAICEDRTTGFIEVLTKPGTDKILGVSIIGANAAELLAEFALAKTHGLGLNKILATLHTYPSWSEANKAVAGQWRKDHIPALALPLLRVYHQFRRRGAYAKH